MKQITITIKRKTVSYKILIGSGFIAKLPKLLDFPGYSSVTIITDSNVGPQYVQSIKRLYIHHKLFVFTFPCGEQHKNLDTVSQSYQFLAQHQVDRKGLIINLGGGVVTDLGGFVAATYLRGIDSINISTTIEAMVDASIGSKVGVNLDHWKNYVGAFHQPRCIIMDIDMLSTLSQRNLIAGFGEIIKHGLISDKNYFDFVISKKPCDFSKDELIDIIKRSCEIKKEIVQKDEKEKNIRKLLNFGHTAGHAIESLCLYTQKPLLHGESVAIGMIVAAKISELLKRISSDDFRLIEKSITRSGLPTKLPARLSMQSIIKFMEKDKKNTDAKIKWVLLSTIGKATINNNVPKDMIIKALKYINNRTYAL